MGKYKEAVLKRLFALSGNECAFPTCSANIIDPATGAIKGEIAHIKGDKKGSLRYDIKQLEEERQGYSNLILLCPNHHTEIDEPANKDIYTETYLIQMKQEQVNKHGHAAQPNERLEKAFIDHSINIEGNTISDSTIIAASNNPGSQIAETINNIELVQNVNSPIAFKSSYDARNEAIMNFHEKLTCWYMTIHDTYSYISSLAARKEMEDIMRNIDKAYSQVQQAGSKFDLLISDYNIHLSKLYVYLATLEYGNSTKLFLSELVKICIQIENAGGDSYLVPEYAEIDKMKKEKIKTNKELRENYYEKLRAWEMESRDYLYSKIG